MFRFFYIKFNNCYDKMQQYLSSSLDKYLLWLYEKKKSRLIFTRVHHDWTPQQPVLVVILDKKMFSLEVTDEIYSYRHKLNKDSSKFWRGQKNGGKIMFSCILRKDKTKTTFSSGNNNARKNVTTLANYLLPFIEEKEQFRLDIWTKKASICLTVLTRYLLASRNINLMM